MNRGSLHTRSFRGIHFLVFRYRWTTNGFTGPKRFRGSRETGARDGLFKAQDWREFADFSFVTFRWSFLFILLVLQFWACAISNYTEHKQWKTFLHTEIILHLTFNPGFSVHQLSNHPALMTKTANVIYIGPGSCRYFQESQCGLIDPMQKWLPLNYSFVRI